MRLSLRRMSIATPTPTSAFREYERRFKVRIHPEDLTKRASKRRAYQPSLEDVFDPRTVRGLSLPPELHQVGGGWSEARREMDVFSVGKGSRPAWAFKDVPGELELTLSSFPPLPRSELIAPFLTCSGLVILPSYFSPLAQRTLIRSCLAEHSLEPNTTNLDTHFLLPSEGLWAISHSNPFCLVPTKASLLSSPNRRDLSRFVKEGTGRVLVENAPGEVLGTVETLKQRKLLEAAPSTGLKDKEAGKLIRDLRWTNLGLFYDVSARERGRHGSRRQLIVS